MFMKVECKMLFDNFEINKMAEYADPDGGTHCEPILSDQDQEYADDEAMHQFWTVFGHYDPFDEKNIEMSRFGADAIRDFDEEWQADEWFNYFMGLLKG